MQTNEGWAIGGPELDLPATLSPSPACGIPPADVYAVAILGERLAALRALRAGLARKISCAYLDVPRLDSIQVRDENLRHSTWLSVIHSHVEAVLALLEGNGSLVVHTDDEGASLIRLALSDLPGFPTGTVFWQKKYGPQSLRGKVTDSHDFLFIYSPSRVSIAHGGGSRDVAWWPWELAGKSEDATKEMEKYTVAGGVPLTAKPEKLIRLILERYTKSGAIFLELFSDTGFASAAAVKCGRLPILLTGASREERDGFAKVGSVVLRDAAKAVGVSGLMQRYEVLGHPKKWTDVVAAAGEAIRLQVPVSSPVAAEHIEEHIIDSDDPAAMPLHAVDMPRLVETGSAGVPSMAIDGPVEAALAAVLPVVGGKAQLAWLRVVPGPDRGTGETPVPSTEWLANLEKRLKGVLQLVSGAGFVTIGVDESDFAQVRFLCDRIVGSDLYAGAAVIPKETGGGKTSLPEMILFYRVSSLTEGKKIGLPAERDFQNPDHDPRRAWRMPVNKGARSGSKNTAYKVRIPPYRWELIGGKLPPGAWRLNPLTGVIWANKLEKAGVFTFRVRAKDEIGRSATATCSMTVDSVGDRTGDQEVWFLNEHPKKTGGAPRILSRKLPRGVLGKEYHAVLRAEGGTPYLGVLEIGKRTKDGRRTRYWEKSWENLVLGVLQDRVGFGKKGNANPMFKIYEEAAGEDDIKVEVGWWDAEYLEGSDPLDHLLSLCSREDGIVVSIAPPTDSLATRALALKRRAIAIGAGPIVGGPSLLPLGGPLGALGLGFGLYSLDYAVPHFGRFLLWLEGFLPIEADALGISSTEAPGVTDFGITVGRDEIALLLDPTDWPRARLVSLLLQKLQPRFKYIWVYHYRGRGIRDARGIAFRRVPFDLTCLR